MQSAQQKYLSLYPYQVCVKFHVMYVCIFYILQITMLLTAILCYSNYVYVWSSHKADWASIGMVANHAHCQPKRKYCFPPCLRLRLRIWSRERGMYSHTYSRVWMNQVRLPILHLVSCDEFACRIVTYAKGLASIYIYITQQGPGLILPCLALISKYCISPLWSEFCTVPSNPLY